MPETSPEPFRSSPMAVRPEWIDYNGHLNLAYYHVLFDQGVDELFEIIGLGPAYARERRLTSYTAESHVCYIRELKPESRVFSTARIVDFDAKRLHLFQELHHCEGWLAATLESLSLSIDMSGPHVTPWPEDIAARIAALAERHARLPRPECLGRSIAIRKA